MSSVHPYFQRVADVLVQIPSEPVAAIVDTLRQAQMARRRIFICANGGSSANASHIVNDLVKSIRQPDRPRFRVFCLSDNTPLLTAIANDISYDEVFSDTLEALADPGDVLVALSGSGNSPNVLRAMAVAREKGLVRVGLTGGDGGKLASLCDVAVVIPSDSMQVIEDGHLVVLHAVFLALCEQ